MYYRAPRPGHSSLDSVRYESKHLTNRTHEDGHDRMRRPMLKRRLCQRKSEGWNASCPCETCSRASVPGKEKVESDRTKKESTKRGTVKERQRVELLPHCRTRLCHAKTERWRRSNERRAYANERSLQKEI